MPEDTDDTNVALASAPASADAEVLLLDGQPVQPSAADMLAEEWSGLEPHERLAGFQSLNRAEASELFLELTPVEQAAASASAFLAKATPPSAALRTRARVGVNRSGATPLAR